MLKVLITEWPLTGHCLPLIGIAHALRERGNEVAFYTGARACPRIEGEGFATFPFKHINEEEFWAVAESRNTFASVRHPLKMSNLMYRWLVETLPGQLSDLSEILDVWQADVILTGFTMWGPIAVLHEARQIPVAVFSGGTACILPGPEHSRFGLGRREQQNWTTRILAQLLAVTEETLARRFRRSVNRLRLQYGLPPLSVSVTEHAGRMPLYLMPTVPEFDYERHDLPSSVQYVGSCVWNKPRNEPSPDWLSQLPHDRPWVHASEGTIHSQQPIVLRATAQGLANLPLQVILTTGGNRNPADLDLGQIAPNVKVVSWVPHTDLLPKTDVFVTNGGAGTVMAALALGVPMVVVPTEWDHPAVARRVVDCGAGVRLSPKRCTPERLRAAVEEVLGNPRYREHARRMQTILSNYDGPRRAAALIEGLSPGQPELIPVRPAAEVGLS